MSSIYTILKMQLITLGTNLTSNHGLTALRGWVLEYVSVRQLNFQFS